jgi:hypothetical protein
MAYYIFLKSLRSLEEFRKNPHVKIPPKSPSRNLQSLAKFKNPIFNSEILFPCFRPGRPCGPLGLRPSRPPLAPLLSRRPKPTGRPKPLGHARHWRICKNMFSSLIRAFSHRRLLSLPSLTHGPHMSESSSPLRRPTPAVSPPRRRSPAPPLRASDAAEPLPLPHHSLP